MASGVTGGRATRPAAPGVSIAPALGLFALAVFLLLQQADITVLDGSSMYAVTESLVQHGSLAVDGSVGIGAADGHAYSKYGLGLSLLSVVPYVIAWPVARVSGHADLVEKAAVATLVPVICAALVAALYLLARRLGGRARGSALVALGTVVGTYLLPYTKDFFAEPLVALGVVIMVERTLARHPAQAAAALALAALARPQAFALAPLLVLVVLVTEGPRPRPLVRTVVPVVLALAVTMAYNELRYDGLLKFGYPGEGFDNPFLDGAGLLLFGSAKSVFLFAPAVVLLPPALVALYRCSRTAFVLLVGNLMITFVLTATWHSVEGGYSWGPRLLIPGLAPSLVALAPWAAGVGRRHTALLALFAVGLLVSASTLVVPTTRQQLENHGDNRGHPRVLRQAELVPEVLRYTARHVDDPGADSDDHRFYVNTWQVNVGRVAGIGGLLAALLSSVPLALLAVVAGRRVRDGLRAADSAATSGAATTGGP